MRVTRTSLLLGSLEIRWYAVVIVAGMVLALVLMKRREGRYHLPKDTSIDLLLWAVPPGVICARLYYVLFSWERFAAAPLEIINLRGGGLAIPGGILGGALGVYLCARHRGIAFGDAADLIAPGLALAQAVGRWGNFFNGEAYGPVVEDPALRFFPLSVDIGGTAHYAAFFFESLSCVLIAVVLLIMERRRALRARGDGLIWYALMYALERGMLEGLRQDSLMRGNLRVTQLLCALTAFAAILVLTLRRGSARPALRALPIVSLMIWVVFIFVYPSLLEILPAALALAGTAAIYRSCPVMKERKE